jgi:hypothetical protein
MEPWEKGYEILKEANKKTEKFRQQVDDIMKNEILSKKDYDKIKELLEKEVRVRNQALEKVEKIHREKTKNLEQQESNDEN